MIWRVKRIMRDGRLCRNFKQSDCKNGQQGKKRKGFLTGFRVVPAESGVRLWQEVGSQVMFQTGVTETVRPSDANPRTNGARHASEINACDPPLDQHPRTRRLSVPSLLKW